MLRAAPSYLREHGRPQSADELAEHNCTIVRGNESDHAPWRFGDESGQTRVRVPGSLSGDGGDVVTGWALAGLGVIMRSLWPVRPHVADGSLTGLLPEGPTPPDSPHDWNGPGHDRRRPFPAHVGYAPMGRHESTDGTGGRAGGVARPWTVRAGCSPRRRQTVRTPLPGNHRSTCRWVRRGMSRKGKTPSVVAMSVTHRPRPTDHDNHHVTAGLGPAADVRRFLMIYAFGLEEMLTKVNILQEELRLGAEDSPIEHVASRLKSVESIARKARRKGAPLTMAGVQRVVHDVAGVRVVCSFVSDVYRVADMLVGQSDVDLIACKDYIASPKPNGYRSLHLILDTPVHMSDRVATARIEVQLRTVAMDFWASLEHKIFYKWDRQVPAALREELLEAARSASALDQTMQRVHREVHRLQP